ncbi:hypothetical protein AVEN_37010-1 [Araneus ventricosus]|uniref:Uncharacterized protein n=1 Tax=Araneus ventricosus TaxID=182803 RepID=A0A4Y2XAK9_ARAVE|nr:hypothetical protein AVEN_37010-1 [Araneus ventricosus]
MYPSYGVAWMSDAEIRSTLAMEAWMSDAEKVAPWLWSGMDARRRGKVQSLAMEWHGCLTPRLKYPSYGVAWMSDAEIKVP